MTIPTEFFQWYITDEVTKKRRLTRYRMTREEALARHPGAEPDLRSLEIRHLNEPGEPQVFNTLPPRE